MNKTISIALILVLTIGVIGASTSFFTQDTEAATSRQQRCNQVIDGHASAGGEHGRAAEAQRSSRCG